MKNKDNHFPTINLKTYKKYRIPQTEVYLIFNTYPQICKGYLSLSLAEFEKFSKRELDNKLVKLFESTYVYLINKKPLHIEECDFINDSYIAMIVRLKNFNHKKGNWYNIVQYLLLDIIRNYAIDFERNVKNNINIDDYIKEDFINCEVSELDENFSEKNEYYKQVKELLTTEPTQGEELI